MISVILCIVVAKCINWTYRWQ